LFIQTHFNTYPALQGHGEEVEQRETRSNNGGTIFDAKPKDPRHVPFGETLYDDQINNNLANPNVPNEGYFNSKKSYNPDTYTVRFGKKRMGSMKIRRAQKEDRLSQVRL
jgi:hypothetical protein